MASFEDLAFDWSSLCQECPECWTPSAAILYFSTVITGLYTTSHVWMLPKPQYKTMVGQVCGSNFETFATYDRFIEARARIKDLVMLYPGPCNRLCQIYQPVCGNDGITYHNICHLEYAKIKKVHLKLERNGRCKSRKCTARDDIGLEYYDDTLRSEQQELLSNEEDSEDLTLVQLEAILRKI